MKSFLALAAIVGFASAACPNSCSGHGTCDRYDACTCFLETPINATFFEGSGKIGVEWTGADCSRRTCPRGRSWSKATNGFLKDGTAREGANDDIVCQHQGERECSDQGLCDRATGLCSCFPGYTGSSCQRTTCPDDCSGHGTCRSNRDFAYDWAIAKTTQIQDDKTDHTELFKETYFASYDKAWDTDMHYGCLCDDGYRGPSCALVECPSAADPLDDKCTVGKETDYQLQYDAPFGGAGWEAAYSQREDGNKEQTDMTQADNNKNYIIDNNGRKVYGCYGAMSGQDCSGRGICDYSSGTCKCFSGYAGTACEQVEEMA